MKSVLSQAATRNAKLAEIEYARTKFELALEDAAQAKLLDCKSSKKKSRSSSKPSRTHPPVRYVVTNPDSASVASGMSLDVVPSVKDPPGKTRRCLSKSCPSTSGGFRSSKSKSVGTSQKVQSNLTCPLVTHTLDVVDNNPNRVPCAFVTSDIKTIKFSARNY